MSNPEYTHALASDMRRQWAMQTASKVGGSYSGWMPRERKSRSSWWLAAVGLGLVIAAKGAGL